MVFKIRKLLKTVVKKYFEYNFVLDAYRKILFKNKFKCLFFNYLEGSNFFYKKIIKIIIIF